MKNYFSIIDCDNNFCELVERLTDDDFLEKLDKKDIKEKIEELEKIYLMISEKFQNTLLDLWDENKDYIDVNEFKDFISMRYSYSNFDNFFDTIEEFKNFYQKEKDWENIEF